MREVVVTGLGLVTPLGLGTKVNWKRLISGYIGINKINNFETSDLPCKIAGQIPFYEDDNKIICDFVGYDSPDHFIGDDPYLYAVMQERLSKMKNVFINI